MLKEMLLMEKNGSQAIILFNVQRYAHALFMIKVVNSRTRV